MTDPKLTQEEREQLIQASAVGQWFQQEREAREAAEARVAELTTALEQAHIRVAQAQAASEAKVAGVEVVLADLRRAKSRLHRATEALKLARSIAECGERVTNKDKRIFDAALAGEDARKNYAALNAEQRDKPTQYEEETSIPQREGDYL